MTVAASQQNAAISPQVQRLETLTISVEEAAHLLGMARGAAYAEVKAGRLRVIRIGRKLRVPRIELDAYINRMLEGQQLTPRIGSAGRSSKPDQLLLHAALNTIQCAAMLALVIIFALELLSVHPLEILCGMVFAYARKMLRNSRLRNKRSRHDRLATRSRLDGNQQQAD